MVDDIAPSELLTRLELYFSVRHVNKALKIFGEIFDHDYDKVAIFLTVAEVCLQAIFHRVALDPARVDAKQLYADVDAVGMTALGISELTGIPRETVRRKVKALIDHGHLALSPKSKNVYLSIGVVTKERFVEAFSTHVKDVGQLVRAVAYYQRDPM